MCDITVFFDIYHGISHNFYISWYIPCYFALRPLVRMCDITVFDVIYRLLQWYAGSTLRIYLHLLVQITLSYHKGVLYQGQDVMYQTHVWYHNWCHDEFWVLAIFFTEKLHWAVEQSSCSTEEFGILWHCRTKCRLSEAHWQSDRHHVSDWLDRWLYPMSMMDVIIMIVYIITLSVLGGRIKN